MSDASRAPAEKAPRPWRAWLAAGVVIVASGWWLWGTGQQDSQAEASQSGRVPVLVAPVVLTEASRIFEAIGTARASKTADIYPNVAETVSEVFFSTQQQVAQGDILVQLDDREERLAVRRAEAARENATALVRRLAQAGEAVSARQLEEARTAEETARVELQQARLTLSERQIRAPFDGVTGLSRLNPGDRVTTDSLITGLDDRTVLYVDFDVPESLQQALQQAIADGGTLEATTPAFAGETLNATLVAQDSRISSAQRTVTARAELPNPDDRLRPGMSFTLTWRIPGAVYPTVPEIALQYDADGAFVWRIADDKAERVPARVVLRRAGSVLLEADLAEGQQVVREGVQRLRPGTAVRLQGAEG